MRSSIQSISRPTAAAWSCAATNREKLSAWLKPFTRKMVSGSPIRSIPPSRIRRSESPASNSANLMLDEPPLIVRMLELAGFINDSLIITQSEQSRFRTGGLVIRVLVFTVFISLSLLQNSKSLSFSSVNASDLFLGFRRLEPYRESRRSASRSVSPTGVLSSR